MSPIAPDTDTLRELDEDMRLAWSTYSDRLRDLTGAEYERVESESWSELQDELERLEHRREQLRAAIA